MNDKHRYPGRGEHRPHHSQPSESGRIAPDTPSSERPEQTETNSDEVRHLGMEQLEADNADLKDRLLRALAEVENMRRRTAREVGDASNYAISKFARDMIAVADNMERAMASVPQAVRERDAAAAAVLQGIELTAKEMQAALEKNGVTKLHPVGQRFDPNFHEAMFEVVDPSKPNGTVSEVLEPGYAIGARPLRPAKVVVTRDKPPD